MAEHPLTNIFTGASGIVLPFRNKSQYPPEFQSRSRLNIYASMFNSIEINSSFYKVPQASTVRKWCEDVPSHFRFTFKLWREITHQKLLFKPEDVLLFFERISAAVLRKGCILVQFPPSITIAGLNQVGYLLSTIQQINKDFGWHIAVEFRNRSWYEDEVYQLLAEYGASVVIQDLPASVSPLRVDDTDVVYLRFHGPNGGYRGSYPDDFLYEYAQYIKEWQEEGKTIYAYFNNTMGDAVGNLASLNNFLTS